ncbi:MAG TPA: VWA domain-containing protein [bacterium]
MEKPADVTIEKAKWYQNIKAILGLISAVLAAGFGLFQLWKTINPPPGELSTADYNTLIVLDRSAAMAEPFDDKTKFEVAKSTLAISLSAKVGQNDNLALRTFGGPCLSENSRLVVGFNAGNRSQVMEAVDKVKPAELLGATTLVKAVIDATGDFTPPKRFEGRKKNILVIAGRSDTCPQTDLEFMVTRLKDIEMDIQIVGMKIPREEQERFAEITKVTGGQALFVNTRKELEHFFNNSKSSKLFIQGKQLYDNLQDDDAAPLFVQAAEQGVSEAMFYLGELYSDTLSVQRDDKKAVEWYRKGAQAGNGQAMTKLGVMNYLGRGTGLDYAQAFSWFQKGAAAGDEEGMYYLASMYDYARGVEREDDVQAVEWYRKAAKLGQEGARERLQELEIQ